MLQIGCKITQMKQTGEQGVKANYCRKNQSILCLKTLTKPWSSGFNPTLVPLGWHFLHNRQKHLQRWNTDTRPSISDLNEPAQRETSFTNWYPALHPQSRPLTRYPEALSMCEPPLYCPGLGWRGWLSWRSLPAGRWTGTPLCSAIPTGNLQETNPNVLKTLTHTHTTPDWLYVLFISKTLQLIKDVAMCILKMFGRPFLLL